MLVLSRKVGEKLVIGDNVTVEVVRIAGNRITLGIVAPQDVKILRGELNKDTRPIIGRTHCVPTVANALAAG